MKRKAFTVCLGLVLLSLTLLDSCDPGLGDDSVTDGKMMFWSDFDGPPIDVYVDGQFEGTITAFFTDTPSCESQGCVTATRSPATYPYHAEEQVTNGNVWNGDITIQANGCGRLRLTP